MEMADMSAVKVSFDTEVDWLKGRTGGIGGSDSPVIAGVSPSKSILELYTEKIGIVEPEGLADNEPIRWGKRLEPLIADAYQEETKRLLINHGIHYFKNIDLGVPATTSVDREIVPIEGRAGPGNLQIKTTGKYSKTELQEEMPIDWQVQVQHELAVLEWEWASMAVLLFPSRKLFWLDAYRNDNFIKALIEKEREFWDRVVNHDAPDPDASESARRVLAKLYPKDKGTTIGLSDEAIEWDARLSEAKSSESKAKEAIDLYGNLFKAAIGEASFGVLPNGVTYSCKHQKRAGYTVKETAFRQLRRMK